MSKSDASGISDMSGISDIDGIRSTSGTIGTSDMSDVSGMMTNMNLNMKRRSFYELQPRNPKKQIRQL